eukprot:ANDGO_04566.mRNA.1 ABC transporter F family member 3
MSAGEMQEIFCGALGVSLEVLSSVFDGPVEEYLLGVLEEQTQDALLSERDVLLCMSPFLVDSGLCVSLVEAESSVKRMLAELGRRGLAKARVDEVKVLQQAVVLERVVMTGSAMSMAMGAGAQPHHLSSVAVNTNADLDDWDAAIASRKQAKKNSKKKDDGKRASDYAKFIQDREEAQKRAMENLFIRKNNDSGANANELRDIVCEAITITMGTTKLIDKASLTISYGRRYGLVGKNGSGKTTLLRHLADYALEGIPKSLQILHVEQEVMADDRTPLQVVLEADRERTGLMDKEAKIQQQLSALRTTAGAADEVAASIKAEEEKLLTQLNKVYEELTAMDADASEAGASQILAGLQFTQESMNAPTRMLSGGWRMRVALARALFIQPDVLLLDEPTNMIDLSALLWLEEYLKGWTKTLVVVSHARDFLNAICTDMVHLHSKNLTYYKGNYDAFENVRRDRLKNQVRLHEAQDKQRKHVQAFIDRFKYKAKTARMAQSRIKLLERMEVIPAVIEDPSICFDFPQPEIVPPPILQAIDISFSYPKSSSSASASASASATSNGLQSLFKDVNFGVTMDSRIAIVGPNGAGKTTLLKVLFGDYEPTTGLVMRSSKVRIGYFSQFFVDTLDLQLSAVENMMARFPSTNANPQGVRAHLSSFGLIGDVALQPAYTLSGGQKSRLVLAMVMWIKPHILIMDEPSTHLDIETVEALIQALNGWDGGIVLVSHDQHLIASVCDEIWIFDARPEEKGSVYRYNGEFEDYKRMFLAQMKAQGKC